MESDPSTRTANIHLFAEGLDHRATLFLDDLPLATGVARREGICVYFLPNTQDTPRRHNLQHSQAVLTLSDIDVSTPLHVADDFEQHIDCQHWNFQIHS